MLGTNLSSNLCCNKAAIGQFRLEFRVEGRLTFKLGSPTNRARVDLLILHTDLLMMVESQTLAVAVAPKSSNSA